MKATITKWPTRMGMQGPYGFARPHGESDPARSLFVHLNELPDALRSSRVSKIGFEFECDLAPPTSPGRRMQATNVRPVERGPDVAELPNVIADALTEPESCDKYPAKKKKRA